MPGREINTVAPAALTGALQGQTSLHTCPAQLLPLPGGHCRGSGLQDNGLGHGGQRGECVATPSQLQKGPLVPGKGGGGRRGTPCLCVCLSLWPRLSPVPRALRQQPGPGTWAASCASSGPTPWPLFWPKATTQAWGSLEGCQVRWACKRTHLLEPKTCVPSETLRSLESPVPSRTGPDL